jgi:hypothetical protein
MLKVWGLCHSCSRLGGGTRKKKTTKQDGFREGIT